MLDSIEAIYQAMANGFVSTSGNATIDGLFSRGGMASMLTTVWLILGALSFAAIMEEAGFLDRLIEPMVRRAHSDAGLITSVAGTCIGLNIVAGDQYVAVVLPSRVFRVEFARRGLAPRMLSRTVEDTGTVTSPLVPWNSCGAYMTGVLGVPDHASTCPSPSSTSSTRSSPSPTRSPASASSTSPTRRRRRPMSHRTPSSRPALTTEGDGHVD